MTKHNVYEDFSWKLVASYLKSADRNTCISTAGVYLLLSMLAEGAVAETREEMDTLVSGNSEKFAEELGEALEKCSGVANCISIHFPKNLTKEPAYAVKISTGFSNMSMTPSRLKNTLILQNILQLKVNWATPFIETAGHFYTAAEGEKAQRCEVPFMERTAIHLNYRETERYVSAAIPFEHGGYMVLAMPKNESISSCVEDPDFLTEALTVSQVSGELIHLSIPQFQLKNHLRDLGPLLQSMGMKRAFDQERSQITNMAEKRVFIETIEQDAEIAVDINGVRALSLTASSAAVGNMQKREETIKSICFDHPFVFAIWMPELMPVPLLIGRYQTPDMVVTAE